MKLNRMRRREGGVVDRRSAGPTGGAGGLSFPGPGGGGSGGLPVGRGGGIGIGVILVIVALIVLPRLFGGGDGFGDALSPFDNAGTVGAGSDVQVDPTDPTGQFVDAVADDVQTSWNDIFPQTGLTYQDTVVVLFRGSTGTGCGVGSASTGPFYCPADRKVYLDTSFFKELEQRFGAGGDFAEAYVIAHEIGHHVQTLLGINGQVQEQSRAHPDQANDLSVRLELQADRFAGVWARSAQGAGILEPGDIEEGLNAAASIGDDRIQEATTGRIDPESFTHGTSAQRVQWLRTGIQVGNPDACDTFSGDI